MYKENGFTHGFYKGLSLNLVKTPIANVIAFTLKDFLNNKFILK